MASELKVNTLTGVSTAGSIAVTGEGNSTTTNLQQGLAKAWVHFDGSGTVAVNDTLNITSLVGQFVLNPLNRVHIILDESHKIFQKSSLVKALNSTLIGNLP